MAINNPALAITKHELDKKERTQAVMVQQRKDFELLCVERQVSAEVKERERKSFLENVLSGIISGDYKRAIESISLVPID